MNNSINNHNKFTNFSEFYKSSKAQSLIKKRHRKEKIFKKTGIIAICISISFLFILIANVSIKSRGAFTQTKINLPISFTTEILDIDEEYESFEDIDFKQVLMSNIKLHFPNLINNRREKIKTYRFFSSKAPQEIKEYYFNNPEIKGKTVNIWLTIIQI